MVVRRTESDRTANGIRLDGVRYLIGRRTESDWAADANGRKPMIYNISLLSTSDAADEEDRVDLGGRLIIK